MSTADQETQPLTATYTRIYTALAELREGFHRSGRLDDSNAKLDEVAKLFAVYLAFKRGQIPSFPSTSAPKLIDELQESFRATVALPQYHLKSGGSIFGAEPRLVLRPGDEALAQSLVSLVSDCVDMAFEMQAESRPFDILNEAFGHFVRDNFRGNVEDAQYMTPPEVVDFIIELVLTDLETDNTVSGTDRPLVVLDPSCGVGSFLSSFYHAARNTSWLNPARLHIFGQDKVERMVRLSTINMELFDVAEHRIYVGNSLAKGSELDGLAGSVDLILTNPPFGARFDFSEIKNQCGVNTPFFSSIKKATGTVDSELLFVDRNLELLRPGGRLMIVVPDGVVSAKGTAALLRSHLSKSATLLSVVELPATTFAQAGTRTKTAIIYLKKGAPASANGVVMAAAKDLGFQVSSRKGVQVKSPEGTNELPAILKAYHKSLTLRNASLPQVLSSSPSCVLVSSEQVQRGSWTPNHYSAVRFETLVNIGRVDDLDMVPLRELVTFAGDSRRAESWVDGYAFVSVLHILGDGFVDVAGALSYAPKTPGVRAYAGEVLMSRINPRIPRICVTPEFARTTLCSSEFEVMSCGEMLDPYALAYLLQTKAVQNQIQSLTSGTSASHNRVRTSDLAEVLIPIARAGSTRAASMAETFKRYREASEALVANTLRLAELREQEAALFS